METRENSICMFTPPATGGMALYTRELLTALSEDPRAAYSFSLVCESDLDDQFRSDRYAVHAILPPLRHRSTFPNRAAWVISRLTHHARSTRNYLAWLKGRPEIIGVHFQEWTPWTAASLIRRIKRQNKKVFYTVHNVIPHAYPKFIPKWLMDGWNRRACNLCDCLFVHTAQLATELAVFLGENHPPIRVVPHGVWTVPESDQRHSLCDRLNRKKLLFFGRIRRNKGLHRLLRCLERMPDYSLTVAGEPQEHSYFENEVMPEIRRLQAAGSKIEVLAHFLSDEEVSSLFAGHSAVVLPYTEQFVAQSGVVFMALAHEIPVVASEAGGLGTLFAQYKIGQTFSEPTPSAIADAIRTLHEGHSALDALKQQMHAAKERFSWREAAAATINGYRIGFETKTELNDCPVKTTLAH